MEARDSFTQTDHEIHDVFYYKTRAYKAETSLLASRRDQYIHQLQMQLKELEKETSNKLRLYTYDPEKTRQLQLDFQNYTIFTEQLQNKAREIYTFNLQALSDGHELNDLPLVDDKDVDISTFRLGPVTPTIPSSSRVNPLLMANLGGSADVPYPSMAANGIMVNGGNVLMNGFPPPTSRAYVFPRTVEEVHQTTSNQSAFKLSSHGQATLLGSQRLQQSHAASTVSQFNDLDIQRTRGEEILRMINIDSPAVQQLQNGHPSLPPFSIGCIASTTASSEATITKPDVIPNNNCGRVTAPSNYSGPAELSISGAMGLDHLDLDFCPSGTRKPISQKWSQIAAGSSDSLTESDWQAVGSKKGRPSSNPPTGAKGQVGRPSTPMSRLINGTSGIGENGANFEQMVLALQEKYLLTRPEVIQALQVVRNERNGDMNMPLTDLMRDAERLLAKNKNVLKPASLTARARAVLDHEEPCENQLCPARLKLLKFRTELCLSFQMSGKCQMKQGSCVYAHGHSELRQLPKEELCDRYLEGKCNNRKCVYAHGASELKNRPMVNTVEYLKSKQKKPHADGSSSKVTEADDFTLTSADIDPRGEECSICFERMSKKSRRKLECGHDTFHYKCLKKWVAGEGDRSCPLCRNNTLLLEEYPHLGTR